MKSLEFHPRTIAAVEKAQLLSLLYGIELACPPRSLMQIWSRTVSAAIKSLFSCSKHCSNRLLKAFDLMELQSYWLFKQKIMVNSILTNDYTRPIFMQTSFCNGFLRKNPDCLARFVGKPFRPKRCPQGEDGIVDSLRSLLYHWACVKARKQFRDLLHVHCAGYLPP